uniref:peptidylprolyl isomerase n=1 Tax=Proboscia inermis TaxID=420281 RepID=A0A7S0CE61_9STRA
MAFPSLILLGSSSSVASAAMYDNAAVADYQAVTLPSGVSYQDLRLGDGDVVSEGKRVNIQWSLKRSNGYSIDSSSNNDSVPFIFIVGAKKGQRAIAGLDEGIRGMRVGGIRRIIMPPILTYVEGLDDGKPGPIPPGFGPKQRIKRVIELRMDVPDESFLLDIKATRVQ